MCNACGFLCCGSDMFGNCGCNDCRYEACHDHACPGCGEENCLCGEDLDYPETPHED